ncbi:alkaline phosphatase family protein [Paraburkholderia ferrariae]|uniref:alkaline phosphatase family protein n=1 Tax=Paraburkholderia ferrariae TaxID=386056 RepID=UPI0004862301|nr:alkaline phosphatase family protein [Paraburkholderia ferrariae]
MGIKQAVLFATVAVAMGAGLSACGGSNSGSGSNGSPASTSTPASTPTASVPGATRVLLVSLDGVSYDAIEAGVKSGALPNLAKLNVSLAYSGGVSGSPTVQANTLMPGWATLLTGTWVNRHGVTGDSTGQTINVGTVFDATKAAKSSNLNGAAVASSGLVDLLAPYKTSGSLDAVTDCSSNLVADDCVTQQAGALIDNHYSLVVAQFHGATDAAQIYGVGSTQYAGAVKLLDSDVGTLLQKAAANSNDKWLVVVTSAYGLSASGVMDGLTQLPEAATFVGVNQPLNATAGVGAAVPATLGEIYAYPGIADVTPTVLSYLGLLPGTEDYAMDGGQLIADETVQDFNVALNSTNANVPGTQAVLSWVPPATGAITVLRDGVAIATLDQGTTTYTDDLVAAMNALDPSGAAQTHQFNYAVQTGTGTALVSSLTPQVTFAPLLSSLSNGLYVYYPFTTTSALGASFPAPSDHFGNSTMGPPSGSLNPLAGTVVQGPFGTGSQALMVDDQYSATPWEDYQLKFNAANLDPTNGLNNTATSSSFTIGFWFKNPQASCVTSGDYPLLANKNYDSGAFPGIALAEYSASTGVGCMLDGNVADGTNRTSDPKLTFSNQQWVYVAMVYNGPAKSYTWYVMDPVLGARDTVVSASAVDQTLLYTGPGTNVTQKGTSGTSNGLNLAQSATADYTAWGVGTDGTRQYQYARNGNGNAAKPANYQTVIADLAIWNRALTANEINSLYGSQLPLSSLVGN